MKKIKLTQGKYALVDDDDYEEASKHKWSFSHGYAKRSGPRPQSLKIYMHRVIMEAKTGQMVDHINGNGLDNRKSNLRFCNKSTNGMNRGKNKNNTSGYKGVSLCNDQKRRKKWMARICINRVWKQLGRFYTPQEASLAYQEASNKYHKEFSSI